MIRELSSCPVDLLGCSVGQLPALIADPHSQEVVTVKCNDGRHRRARCDTDITCTHIVSVFVACDACREKAISDEANERHRKYWEAVCPERYRLTDLNHADFPKAIYGDCRKLMADNPSQSFFLYGPTGTCKTRLGMMLLKRALHADNRVGVLWPEKLATIKESFGETRTFDRYADYDTLLMDDTLLTACREPKLTEALKQLIDVRMRHNRPFIITSQIGEEGFKSGKEYGELKDADIERIDALIRRLREECRVVSFAKPEPKAGETAF
jgi:DNA replication protein DnaC